MTKAVILLAVTGVVLACSGAVLAGAEKIAFLQEPWTSTVEGGIHANAHGWVIVKTAKGGGADVTVQLQQAAPRYTYVVKSNGKVLGTFKTDAKGNGGLQLYVPDPGATLGRWINIWQTGGEPEGSYWGTYSDWNDHVANGTTGEFGGLGLLYGPRW